MKHITQRQMNEDGFSAIIVTMVIVALITLIGIGFVRTVTREQRASLDRQLSTQAFYAAETGVSDAVERLSSSGPFTKNDCDMTGWDADLDEGISYTCVLVDPEPRQIVRDDIGTQVPVDILLNPVDDDGNTVSLNELTIEWQAQDYPATGASMPTSNDVFPPSYGDAAPVLRITLTPIPGTPASASRQNLSQNTFTAFLRPRSAAPASNDTTPYIGGAGALASQGQIINVNCDINDPGIDYVCRHTINNLSATAYIMSVRAIYFDASLRLTGTSGGDQIRFAEEQAIIDSTGRASDVLRRIQVRVPLRETFDYPGFALETGSGDDDGGICKVYGIYPGGSIPVNHPCSY